MPQYRISVSRHQLVPAVEERPAWFAKHGVRETALEVVVDLSYTEVEAAGLNLDADGCITRTTRHTDAAEAAVVASYLADPGNLEVLGDLACAAIIAVGEKIRAEGKAATERDHAILGHLNAGGTLPRDGSVWFSWCGKRYRACDLTRLAEGTVRAWIEADEAREKAERAAREQAREAAAKAAKDAAQEAEVRLDRKSVV